MKLNDYVSAHGYAIYCGFSSIVIAFSSIYRSLSSDNKYEFELQGIKTEAATTIWRQSQ